MDLEALLPEGYNVMRMDKSGDVYAYATEPRIKQLGSTCWSVMEGDPVKIISLSTESPEILYWLTWVFRRGDVKKTEQPVMTPDQVLKAQIMTQVYPRSASGGCISCCILNAEALDRASSLADAIMAKATEASSS